MLYSNIRPAAKMTLDSRAAFDNYNNTWKEENCSSISASTCVCVCPAPFLSAGWLGVTLSLSTSLPAPLDPVAISNRLRELASPLLQPIAFTSLCNCVHECE